MTAAIKSFTNSLMANCDIYHILSADDLGRSVHIFLKPAAAKKAQLNKLLNDKTQNIDFAQYGEILATSQGRFLSANVRKVMKDKYNYGC